jgi:hypothetical protein
VEDSGAVDDGGYWDFAWVRRERKAIAVDVLSKARAKGLVRLDRV